MRGKAQPDGRPAVELIETLGFERYRYWVIGYWAIFFSAVTPDAILLLGMLNDYRIFDCQIKCSFSFSFVAHSILGFWKYRARVIVKERTVQAVKE